jgi:hypothetical protein
LILYEVSACFIEGLERSNGFSARITQLLDRRDCDVFTAPPATAVVGEGDGVV